MKKLALIATILILFALLCVLVPSLVFAQTWASFSDLDHTTGADEFTVLNCTVYMYGEGHGNNSESRIVYWDGGNNKRVSEIQIASPPSGALSSQHTFDEPDVAGDWHCAVYKPATYDPDTYNPSDTNLVADDTSYTGGYAFNVAASAIPEFPTIMAAIGVAGLCFAIYYWMRRRVHRVYRVR